MQCRRGAHDGEQVARERRPAQQARRQRVGLIIGVADRTLQALITARSVSLRSLFHRFDGRAGGRRQALEHQQALVIAALRAAGEQPVSYEQLRDAGVEFPASVLGELELAGVEIERCHEHPGGRGPVIGVRLPSGSAAPGSAPSGFAAPGFAARGSAARGFAAPGFAAREATPADAVGPAGVPAPEPATAELPRAGGPASAAQPSHAPAARRLRLPVAGALVAVVAAVIAVVVLAGGGAGGDRTGTAASAHRAGARASRAHRSAASAAAGASAQATRAQARPATVPAVPVSSALADRLEAQGHELLQAGRYAAALPVLRSALAATGEQLQSCLQPSEERCLTFAYALYDLGRALLLDGSPGAAVTVLERRLQIENQRPVVAAELASARRRLG